MFVYYKYSRKCYFVKYFVEVFLCHSRAGGNGAQVIKRHAPLAQGDDLDPGSSPEKSQGDKGKMWIVKTAKTNRFFIKMCLGSECVRVAY